MAYKNTDEYITSFPEDIQELLEQIRLLVHHEIPEATEEMMYGVPGFKLKGRHLIMYAAFKHHIGIYPEPEAIKYFEQELKGYKTSKGAITIPLDQPLPMSIIKKIIAYKAEQ